MKQNGDTTQQDAVRVVDEALSYATLTTTLGTPLINFTSNTYPVPLDLPSQFRQLYSLHPSSSTVRRSLLHLPVKLTHTFSVTRSAAINWHAP